MSNDIIVVIALLKSLKLITKKEAVTLYDELKYKNLSTSLDDSLEMIDSIFKKNNIGMKQESVDMTIGGQKIKVMK